MPLTYKWTQTSGPTVILNNLTSVSPTFTAPATGSTQTMIFQLVVTNSLVISSSADTVTITVNPSGTLPQVPDCITSQTGNKVITGTAGSDILVGTTGSNVIRGLAGNDAINGCSGIDNIFGNNGNDAISGGSQDDRN